MSADPAAAEREARKALEKTPNDARALLNLGKALRAQGRDAEAAESERKSIAASTRDARHRRVAEAMRAGKTIEANQLLQRLVEENGEDVLALMLFGSQASKGRQYELADQLLSRAVALAPADPNARFAMADHQVRTKRFEDALATLAALPDEMRKSEGAQSLEAECLGELGRVKEQLVLLRDIAASSANPLQYNLRIGHALRTLGRQEEAGKAYRAVIAQIPAEGTSWWSLANLKTTKFTEADIAAMRAGLDHPTAPVENRIRLNFALGKAYEDRKDAANAFRHYDEGNRLRRSIAPYDPGAISTWVDACIATFTAEFFAGLSQGGDPSNQPIFVIGMQRSGSTLVEQILASHPKVEGTSELNELRFIVEAIHQQKPVALEKAMAALSPDERRQFGARYLETTAIHRRTDRPRFTDKMPNNWLHVALIRSILPNARVIDVRRNPMDCCFSNWKQLYARGLDHSNALETMGQFYADYVRLMRHYDAALPGFVHRVIYEELVADVESETRRLLDYLGLEFDPACLQFHSTERPVLTISAGQVREPINRKGIDAWHPFERYLEPLKAALGPVIQEWRI
ncbi:tetratricopeptide repeat protein [Sphingomonas sp. HDW15A]|uniref:tetratricopeptide repeat-containing sulfotransferase family protein n=1 Tax=Sphingomonas sp. HDW15A TaxID=2714942 RepID=UPI001408CA31|nr:tetratricopeptide repeat-containing sulfotransferase family protein [Sphingomonas sp. HDW15A]QIK96255.1 tetratricopeptide repeat protein [Sphingomonas sp. HDW15A]